MVGRLRGRLRRVVAGEAGDRGAAVAEFAMVSVLLVLLLFAVLQIAVLFYLRNIVAASASDGARYAASAGVDYAAGGERATRLIRQASTDGVGRAVPCQGSAGRDAASGLPLTVVTCAGRVRSFFLPIGAFVPITATSHALREGEP